VYYLESLVADENRTRRFPLVYSGNVLRFLTEYFIDCCKYEFADIDKMYICSRGSENCVGNSQLLLSHVHFEYPWSDTET
jgi:hypothetical protein